MHEIEPWQLYPMPPEQVEKIRAYITRREQQAVAEQAAEVERLTLLLEQAEQYARDLQDGSAPGLAEVYDADRPDRLEHAFQALFDLVEKYGGERLQEQQAMWGEIENAMEELADASIVEGKRQALAIIEAESETDGELYRFLILGEDGSASDAT